MTETTTATTLTPIQTTVFKAVAELTEQTDDWATTRSVAELIGRDVSTARRHLKALRDMNVVTSEGSPRGFGYRPHPLFQLAPEEKGEKAPRKARKAKKASGRPETPSTPRKSISQAETKPKAPPAPRLSPQGPAEVVYRFVKECPSVGLHEIGCETKIPRRDLDPILSRLVMSGKVSRERQGRRWVYWTNAA